MHEPGEAAHRQLEPRGQLFGRAEDGERVAGQTLVAAVLRQVEVTIGADSQAHEGIGRRRRANGAVESPGCAADLPPQRDQPGFAAALRRAMGTRLRSRGTRGKQPPEEIEEPHAGGSKDHGRRAAQRVLCRMSYSVWSAEEVIHATKWIQCCDHGVTPQRSQRRLRRSEPSLCDRPATLCIS